MRFQHRREDDAVEHDVVLADKMYEPCLRVLPPFLPAAPCLRLQLTEFLRVGNIADGGVKPNVQYFSLSTFNRNRDSPVQVTGHGTGFQSCVEPRFALSIHIGTPFLVLVQNPVFKPWLILVKRQIPMAGLFANKRIARVCIIRINQFLGR